MALREPLQQPCAEVNGWHSIETVMFDFDGTLVDSLDCYHTVFVDTFTQEGLPLVDKAVLMELMRHGQNMMEALIPADLPERETTKKRCITTFRDMWIERSLTAVSLHPEVAATVRTLFDRGLVLGVATAAQGPWIEHLLKEQNISRCFSAIVTYADVPVRKPAPDILLECLQRLAADSSRSVYVGDSPIDIIAAKAAGVRSIGVLSGTSDRASLEVAQPEIVLEHVGQLPALLTKEEGPR